MQMRPWLRTALAAAYVMLGVSAASAATLFQVHDDHTVWKFTGLPCSGDSCPNWLLIDNDTMSRQIAASRDANGEHIYKRDIYEAAPLTLPHPTAGTPGISRWNGSPNHWTAIDGNARTIQIAVTAGDLLYQLHNNGQIWRAVIPHCDAGAPSCTGWELIDNNSQSVQIAVSSFDLYQRHSDGSLWKFTGGACAAPSDCRGWTQIDNNPHTIDLAAGGIANIVQLHDDHSAWIWVSGTNWNMIDNNPNTVKLVTGQHELFQLHNDGKVWRYTFVPCRRDGVCKGWEIIDNNPSTREIATDGDVLFQRHADGTIWQWGGEVCGNTCTGWTMIDSNPRAVSISGEVH